MITCNACSLIYLAENDDKIEEPESNNQINKKEKCNAAEVLEVQTSTVGNDGACLSNDNVTDEQALVLSTSRNDGKI